MSDEISPTKKQKIAILGGGVGAVTAAFMLTSSPGWRDRYEITLYQMGWRLGGKGASGRNRKASDRIEEHGLHLWLGFYENAFRMMRQCYSELARSEGAPLAGVFDAFKPYPIAGVVEKVDADKWSLWLADFPLNKEEPGEGKEFLPVWENIIKLLELALHIFRTTPIDPPREASVVEAVVRSTVTTTVTAVARATPAAGSFATIAGQIEGAFERVSDEFERVSDKIEDVVETAIEDVAEAYLLHGELPPEDGHSKRMHEALRLLQESPDNRNMIIDHLIKFKGWLWDRIKDRIEAQLEESVVLRRLWIIVDLTAAVTIGVLRDDVLFKGWDAIDGYDLMEWLKRNGATELSYKSGLIRGIYDFVFAYEEGDTDRPNIAAGSMLRAMLRMMLEYRRSIFFTMEAGMGDVVFAPLYTVLERRGVKFEFFSKVTNLGLDAEKRGIETIAIDRQVYVKGPPGVSSRYEPLFDVKGLPSWPSEPLYEQIMDGDKLEAGWTTKNYNLESWWSAWQPVEKRTLKRGQDFDVVVLGIAIGALPVIAKELIDARPGTWGPMVKNITTVQTQAMQLWCKPSLTGLGWDGAATVLDAYAQPMNTYADLSHLIKREAWPDGNERPSSLAYFCGPMSDPPSTPPFSDHGFPGKEADRVRSTSIDWLNRYPKLLWPLATTTNDPNALNYWVLADPEERRGEKRFDAQYWRANMEPSERYVMSPKGSTVYRLDPGKSGFENLYLAGDWTKNAINTGCVEGAVTSGMAASRAISGYPEKIVGECDKIIGDCERATR